MAIRTFKLGPERMHGGDIREWQEALIAEFKSMDIDNVPLKVDGQYGPATRSITAALCRALGVKPEEAMAAGVTPDLRRKLRDRDLTAAEKKIYNGAEGKRYRADLRKRWHPDFAKVHPPVAKILADSWGFHPPVHDGLDVICLPDAVIFAMCHAKVIDVRGSGWWGKGAPSNPAVKSKGDGIIQLEVLETVGPFVKGHHIGYGHAEKARVKVGDVVRAGEPIGHAGLANAWHVHLMYNDGSTTKGVGNRDPRPILNYSVANG